MLRKITCKLLLAWQLCRTARQMNSFFRDRWGKALDIWEEKTAKKQMNSSHTYSLFPWMLGRGIGCARDLRYHLDVRWSIHSPSGRESLLQRREISDWAVLANWGCISEALQVPNLPFKEELFVAIIWNSVRFAELSNWMFKLNEHSGNE